MPLTLNTKVLHLALGMAHAGNIDHGSWFAPEGSARTSENCIGHETGDDGKASEKYPILSGDKVSARGIASALGYAKANNETVIIPALEKIDAAIHSNASANLSRELERFRAFNDALQERVETMELSRTNRPRLARCPDGDCASHNVERLPAASGEGPTDRCKNCGRSWPHKPGTITAEQLSGGDDLEKTEETTDPPMPPPDVIDEPPPTVGTDELPDLRHDNRGTPMVPPLESSTARGLYGVQ